MIEQTFYEQKISPTYLVKLVTLNVLQKEYMYKLGKISDLLIYSSYN